jgi:AraC-like DNA-binding protein
VSIVSPDPKFVSRYREANFEFADRIFAERGTLHSFTEGLRVCSLLQPTRIRVGALSKPFQLCQPSARVVAPETESRLAWQGATRAVSVLISPRFIESVLGRTFGASTFSGRHFAGLRQRDHGDDVVKSILSTMAIEVRNSNPSGPMFLETLTSALVHHALPRSVAETSIPRSNGLSPRQLSEALNLIESNLASRISLSELACALDISVSYFCRAFRRSTGISPYHFIIKRRVERARALIENGKMPLVEVALTVGFSDHSQMSSTFRKELNVPPSFFAAAGR